MVLSSCDTGNQADTTLETCLHLCHGMMKDYNNGARKPILSFILEETLLELNFHTHTLKAYVRMRYESGNEPIGTFDADDEEELNATPRAMLDGRLRGAKLPFTVECLVVPPEYNTK